MPAAVGSVVLLPLERLGLNVAFGAKTGITESVPLSDHSNVETEAYLIVCFDRPAVEAGTPWILQSASLPLELALQLTMDLDSLGSAGGVSLPVFLASDFFTSLNL